MGVVCGVRRRVRWGMEGREGKVLVVGEVGVRMRLVGGLVWGGGWWVVVNRLWGGLEGGWVRGDPVSGGFVAVL